MSRTPLSRRTFLVNGVRLTALGSVTPSLGAAAWSAAAGAGDRVLVVVQLSGGNDGLNTVIPFGQDAYFHARPTLAQNVSSLHALDDRVALHPALRGISELYDEGSVALVHGVGHPNSDRSHFRSMEIWHTAEPFAPAGRVGWLGHMADQILARSPGSMPALSVGGGTNLLSLRGATLTPPTVPSERGFELAKSADPIARQRDRIVERGSIVDRGSIVERGSGADQGRAKKGSDLEFLRASARTAYDAAERMSAIAGARSTANYPNQPLARELRLIAQLIQGGFGTRIFHVQLGGFDTHANQGLIHAALLEQLSRALTAFQRDLAASGQADRVATLVFSEFGRRVQENASRGTDHGRGNPVFVIGSKVTAGQHGSPPDLADLVEGDVPSTTDFRGIYQQLERDWMGLRSLSKAKVESPRIV